MNTTVAIVLPVWMVGLLALLVVLSVANEILGLYLNHLKKKLINRGVDPDQTESE